jgi:hypothetical protein
MSSIIPERTINSRWFARVKSLGRKRCAISGGVSDLNGEGSEVASSVLRDGPDEAITSGEGDPASSGGDAH